MYICVYVFVYPLCLLLFYFTHSCMYIITAVYYFKMLFYVLLVTTIMCNYCIPLSS